MDYEKVIREILSDFLTMEGYVVRTVEDGSVAMKELMRRPYDLCISDLKMPVMDGLELLEKISEENLNVLTVIMTGFGTVETLRRSFARAVGASPADYRSRFQASEPAQVIPLRRAG